MRKQFPDIRFDESDKNLFQVDDPRLRADALRFSVLPRLHALLNEALAKASEVYQIDVMEDSIVFYSPHFRTNRDNELQLLYGAASVALGGKRARDGRWKGLKRKDSKIVQIVPFLFGFQLTAEGMTLQCRNWSIKLSDSSFEKFFRFNAEYEPLIQRLCHESYMRPYVSYGDSCKPISTYKQHYDFIIENKIYDLDFFSSGIFRYPITAEDPFYYSLADIVDAFVSFYPVYDSYIQLAKGENNRFEHLVEKLNDWLIRNEEKEEELTGKQEEETKRPSEEELLKIKQLAEQGMKVMPALRWQVFQRDKWRCVSCGRTADNDVILHVDHIVPRSKGGKDELDNFQTLCHVCNFGKGNKDDTNIRELRR
ncbi:MAG: HNH endonuclease [Deltaproteobacteria bacterium]|nr:HNH endonuclease [Deltaproteobacteria bacterium]